MVDSETVRLMKELSQRGWKLNASPASWASRNTVCHYVRDDASAGLQKRTASCRLDDQQRAEARRLLDRPAAGNAVVVKRLLCEQGEASRALCRSPYENFPVEQPPRSPDTL